jgi:uncharacterized glyoxalase superfamily protein PhnB
MSKKRIREGYQAVTPYLLVPGVPRLVTFLTEAFDAKEIIRLDRPDGSVMHVEVRIRDSAVMMGEPSPRFGPMPGSVYLYVEDCDIVYQRAIDAGGISVLEVTDMPHAGERYGGVKDPSGNIWWVASQIGDAVSPPIHAA